MRGTGKAPLIFVALVFVLAAGRAHAQVGNTGYRPPVSPYINLLRPGTNPAINYYGLVRPQVEFRNNILGLQQQVGALDTQVGIDEAGMAAFPTTGHPVAFMNYSHYFGGTVGTGTGLGGRVVPRTTTPAVIRR